MEHRTVTKFLRRFFQLDDGFTSVEWVVIASMVAGFAYATGSLLTNDALVLSQDIDAYVAAVAAPE